MRRAEVWWADLAPPTGRRPVLLLSRNDAIPVRTMVTVAPLTRNVRGIPTEVVLDQGDGVPARSVVNLDNIVTVPQARLQRRITALSGQKMDLVRDAIIFALALGANP